jgi:hypothetical protein
MGGRVIFPAVSCVGTVCTVTAPPNGKVSPPGWHQLFVLDGPTPSHGVFVRVGGDPAFPRTSVTGLIHVASTLPASEPRAEKKGWIASTRSKVYHRYPIVLLFTHFLANRCCADAALDSHINRTFSCPFFSVHLWPDYCPLIVYCRYWWPFVG